jgi:hypothetical protein
MRNHQLTACFVDEEWLAIRRAYMCGKLPTAISIRRSPDSGEVTFSTQAPRRLCRQLEAIVDFGAVSATEVLQCEKWEAAAWS